MKKNYIVPAVTIVNVKMQHTLLTASNEVGVSSEEYNEVSNGPIRSRGGASFWDDDEW